MNQQLFPSAVKINTKNDPNSTHLVSELSDTFEGPKFDLVQLTRTPMKMICMNPRVVRMVPELTSSSISW